MTFIQNNYLETDSSILQNLRLTRGFPKDYNNFYEDRRKIRKDHKGHKYSRIYIFYNKNDITKMYIGQSINLLGRLKNYLNNSFLQSHKNQNSLFISALWKYGQSYFGLIILEYVKPEILNEREMHWIKTIQPYYNVLTGGTRASTGFLHSEKTKELLRNSRLGKNHFDKTKTQISESLKGSSNPFYGKKHTSDSLLAISNRKSQGFVYIYNELWEPLLIVSSIKLLRLKVNSNFRTIKNYIDSNKLFWGRWYFTSNPLESKRNFPLINSPQEEAIFKEIINSAHIRKAVFVYNAQTMEFIRKYDGVIECAKDLKISHNTITKSIKNNSVLENYIFSRQRIQ